MMKPWNRWIKWAALYCGALLFLYFSITVLTPTLGTIIGYADQQPALQIIQQANAFSPESADKIRPQLDAAAQYARDEPTRTVLGLVAAGAVVAGLLALARSAQDD